MSHGIKILESLLCLIFFMGCSYNRNESMAMKYYWDNNLKGAEATFEEVKKRGQLSDSGTLFYAETLRRNGHLNKAEAIVDTYSKAKSGNSFAMSIKGDIWNAQFHAQKGNLDSALKYYKSAIKNDSGFMNANCSLWILGQYFRDSSLENNSIRRLDKYHSWTQKALAYNKWVLNSCPRNAILFVNGDVDTYPSIILELDSNFRKDVSILNFSLLNLKWYANQQIEKIKIQLDKNVEKRIVDTASRIAPLVFSDSVMSVIVDSLSGRRPICFALTLNHDYYTRYDSRTQLIGGVWLLKDNTYSDKYNLLEISKSFSTVKYADFASKDVYSRDDISPVRKSVSKDPFMEETILSLGNWCSKEYFRIGNDTQSGRMGEFVKDFNEKTINMEKYRDASR